MEGLQRDPLFVALTRPQMFAGVTYSYAVVNLIAAAELFLLFKSAWVVLPTLLAHLAGVMLCAREPRVVDLWITRVSRCPRVRNHAIWRCNSYRP